MESSFKSIILFCMLACFTCCETSNNKAALKILNKSQIDSLHSRTTKVIISFYVNFSNSEIRITSNPIENQNELDSIFHFIEGVRNDTCTLHSTIKPDGLISFYEMDDLIVDFIFVLSDNCNGFYNNFTLNPEKYIISHSGRQNLSKLKEQIFESLQNNR